MTRRSCFCGDLAAGEDQQVSKQQTMASRPPADAAPPAQKANAAKVAATRAVRVVSAEPVPLDEAHFPALAPAGPAAKVRPWLLMCSMIASIHIMDGAFTQVCIILQPVARRKIQPTRVTAVAVDQRFAAVQPSAVLDTQGSRATPSHGVPWGAAQASTALQHAAVQTSNHTSPPSSAFGGNGVGHAASLERLMSGGALISRVSTRTVVTEGGSQPGGCRDPAQLPERRQPRNATIAVKLEQPPISRSAASVQVDDNSNNAELAAQNGSRISSPGNDSAPHAQRPTYQCAKDQHAAAPPGPPHGSLLPSVPSGSRGGATEMHAGAAELGILTPPATRLAQLHAALLGCTTAVAVSAELAVLVHMLALRGESSGGGRGGNGTERRQGGKPPLITAATALAYACAVLQASGAPGRVYAAAA